jgi:O-antigen/teichoic acid export membrane protein
VFPALIIAVSVFILTTNNMLNAVFFGWNAYQKSFSMLLISRSFLIASFFVLYVLQADLLWMMSAFLLSALIHFVYLIQELKRNNLRIGLGRFSVSELKRILISSLPMGLGMIFVWIYDRVDVLILRGFTDDTMVAYFAIAYSLYKAPQAFANFILTPLFSDLSNEFSQKKFISSTTISQRFTHLLFFILPILLILMIISGWLPSFIYGSRYAVASPYFLYLLIALPGLLFNNFSGTTLNAARQELVVAKTVAAGAALNILLNVYLIPTYAVQGCVIATIITEYAVFLLQLYWIIKLKIIMRPEERRW